MTRPRFLIVGAGSIGRPRETIWKCRWQPIVRALPVAPTLPIRCAVRTTSPTLSRGACFMCEYQ